MRGTERKERYRKGKEGKWRKGEGRDVIIRTNEKEEGGERWKGNEERKER